MGKRKEEERQKIKDKDCNLGIKALPYARKGEASCRKDVRMEKRKRKEEGRRQEGRSTNYERKLKRMCEGLVYWKKRKSR